MIKWIQGNTLPLVVELKEVIKTQTGTTTEDYIPPVGSEIEVCAIGKYKKKQFAYTIDGNVLQFTDDGTLSVGTYGISITVLEPESRRLRSFKCDELQIVNCTQDLDLGEFIQNGAVTLDAMPFFWAKGDPFTYEDFTPEEIEDLKRPATEAAAEVAALEQRIEAAEAQRVQAEQGRVGAEQGRVSAEQGRQTTEGQRAQAETQRAQAEILRQSAETLRAQAEGTRQQNEQTRQTQEAKREQDMEAIKTDYASLKEDYASVKSDVVAATGNANDAATLANQKAGAANDAATNANEKATYAKNQGDYAKEKADEIEDAKGTYQTLDARLDAMEEDTDNRLERITNEQFNEIFT